MAGDNSQRVLSHDTQLHVAGVMGCHEGYIYAHRRYSACSTGA